MPKTKAYPAEEAPAQGGLRSVPPAIQPQGNTPEKRAGLAAAQADVAADPSYPAPYRNLGLLGQLQGLTGEAIAAYCRYLERVPDDGEAHHNLGLLYMGEGLTAETQAAFQAASLFLSPEDAETMTNLGVGRFFCGDLDHAAGLLEQALGMDPSFIAARYYLGLTRLHQGRCAEAIAALEEVLAVAPDYPQAKANLGVAYNSAGRPRRAVAIFEALLRKQPDNPSLLLNLAFACQDAGSPERAAACFSRVIATNGSGSPYVQKARHALDVLASSG